MRECPVCRESFVDEFNFCDLDGTPLDGAAISSAPAASNRLWSVVGVALLLGAVGISAASIIFFPRRPLSSTVNPAPIEKAPSAKQTGVAAAGSEPTGSQSGIPGGQVAQSQPAAAATNEDTSEAVQDPNRSAYRKSAGLRNADEPASAPDPKAAAMSADVQNPNTGKRVESSPVASERKAPPPEAVPAVRTAAEPSPAGSAARTNSQTSEVRKDPKRRVSKSQASDNSNRKDGKEKKGGFFKIFKKIFGQG